MRELSKQELRQLQLDILRQFAAYCEKQGLRYQLYAGTLLGAVRHRGFIPWDDDVDLTMPRPDYERLQQLAEQTPNGPTQQLRSAERCENYNAPFLKLTDLRTD